MSERLLEAIIWQNSISILQRAQVLHELRKLNRKVEHMATAEQVAELVSSVAALKETVDLESAAIQAKIDELEAAQGDQPDPALAAAIAELKEIRNTAASQIAGGAEPDEPPA